MASNKENAPARKKKFLSLPKYPGGSSAFKRFLSDNLSYPEEALQKGVEGDVYVKFRVNDLGVVFEAHIEKGIGHGCDEEALRLVHLLKYEAVKNRGMRVQSSMRTRIPFRINKKQADIQIVYQASAGAKKISSGEKVPEQRPPVYSYTIRFQQETPGSGNEVN
ncbi:MAG: TonB family protein [Bacteroidales bacterium]|nr:TonB family protein [Lentimicrobiaceae bacterium]MDD5695967.1 TonB family protein [Bacteroidales bacterium]